MMNSGVSMTRFRAWMDSSHMVRKLVLIEQGANTRIVITLVITSINQPMHITMPSTTLIFILPGTTATATPTPSMTVTPTAQPTVTTTPPWGRRRRGDQHHGSDQHTDPGPDRGRSHPLVT